jgi:hypothetical protein
MGYELRLYAGELTPISSDTGLGYLDCILSVDLSKPGITSKIMGLDDAPTGVPVYFHYGQKYTHDSYEASIKAYPLQSVIEALRADAAEDDYRRYKTALMCMESLNNDQYKNVHVAFVGH